MKYTEPIYALVRNRMAIAVMPKLYTLILQDPELIALSLVSPHVTCTIAMLAAAPADRSPQISECRDWIARQN